MEPFVSQAEFARYRGVSRFAVTHWKRRGLLVMKDGRVDVAASETLIDARPEKFQGGTTNRRSVSLHPAKTKTPRKAGHTATEEVAPAVEAATGAYPTTAEAVRHKESALARTRELEYLLKAKNAVAISDVVETVAAEYAVVRDRLLQLPGKAADRVCGLDRYTVEKILRDEVYEALTALSVHGGPDDRSKA
jgi:hypothetical protein